MIFTLHTTSTSKELESNMRLRNQTSLKRLTLKKGDSLNTKPSLIAILLIIIALLQVPISLKASFSLVCLFSEANNNKTLFFCND